MRALRPITAAALLLALPPGVAAAQDLRPSAALQPIPSFGESCPSGWRGGDRQCWPGPGAREVIRREGTCPAGWTQTVGWCQRGLDAPAVRPRAAAGCPAGWRWEGAYCVEG